MTPSKPLCLLIPGAFPGKDEDGTPLIYHPRQGLFGPLFERSYQVVGPLTNEHLNLATGYRPIIGLGLAFHSREKEELNRVAFQKYRTLVGPFLSLPESLFLFQDPFECLLETDNMENRFRYPSFEILDAIHRFCAKNRIPSSRAILGITEGGGPKNVNKKSYDLYYEEHPSLVPVRFLYNPNLEACTAKYHSSAMRPELASTLSHRNKKFTYLNKESRPQRTDLCAILWARKMLDNDFYWSFLRDREAVNNNHVQRVMIKKQAPGFLKILPKVLDVNYLDGNGKRTLLHPGDPGQAHLFFNDSYLSLISETTSGCTLAQDHQQGGEGQHTFLTEKTFKCFYFKHPFLVWSYPGTLKAIKDLGYQTFSPWINEEYDEIEGYKNRMEAIIDEVARLKALTHDQLHEMRTEMYHILVYNFEHLSLFNVQIRNQINFRKQLGL